MSQADEEVIRSIYLVMGQFDYEHVPEQDNEPKKVKTVRVLHGLLDHGYEMSDNKLVENTVRLAAKRERWKIMRWYQGRNDESRNRSSILGGKEGSAGVGRDNRLRERLNVQGKCATEDSPGTLSL